jgi:hypothetical protein
MKNASKVKDIGLNSLNPRQAAVYELWDKLDAQDHWQMHPGLDSQLVWQQKRNSQTYKCSGYHSGVAEDFVLVEFDAASQGNWILIFQGNIVSSPSRIKMSKKTQHHIPKEWNDQPVNYSSQCCSNSEGNNKIDSYYRIN